MEAQKNDLKQLEEYIQKYYPNLKDSDFVTMIDIIYMSALRNNIAITVLLSDLYKGILDIDNFKTEKSGNIYEFIDQKYRTFAERIKDITVGSNGGMANVGKGEWLITLGCGINPELDKPYVNIIKNGKGDIQYILDSKEINEEVKWNGGKVSVEKSGKEVTRKFNSLINIQDKTWVPFRKNINDTHEEIKLYNAKYWQAISGEENISLTNNQLRQKIINMSFTNVFKKSDSFIMFNDDGKFHRFYNVEQANMYYSDKLEQLKGTKTGFECRASQSNPIALYCYVF